MYELYKPFDFLSKDECQEIIHYGRTHHIMEGELGLEEIKNVNKTQRQGNICWCNLRKYKKKILKVFKTFNKNLVLKSDLQITFYKHHDFYNWHQDFTPGNYQKDKYWFGFVREWQRLLSITVELQPAPKAGLYLDSNVYPFIPRNEDLTIKIKQGQAFVFSSTDYHMARNLGSGERISLVAWGSKLIK